MKTLSQLGAEDIKRLLQSRSPSGFSLKELIQMARKPDLEAVAIAANSVWMNTCGFGAARLGSTLIFDSPAQGFSPYLRGNPEFYLQLETIYTEVLMAWNAPVVKLANIPFAVRGRTINRITTKDQKIILAQSYEAGETSITLTKVIEVENEGRLAAAGLSPDHPLAMTLSGYKSIPNFEIKTEDITDVIEEECLHLRIEKGGELQKELLKIAEEVQDE